MKALVVYESMFGNTRQIAESIADALRAADPQFEVILRRVSDVQADDIETADTLVVGCPTHAWSMPRPRTRSGIEDYAHAAGRQLAIEPERKSRVCVSGSSVLRCHRPSPPSTLGSELRRR